MWFLNILEGSDHSGDNTKASIVSISLSCSDVNGEWDYNDAKVVCRMLGRGPQSTIFFKQVPKILLNDP